MNDSIVLFTGSSHPRFAEAMADRLGVRLGERKIIRFSNENIRVELESVRGKDCFVVQTAAPPLHDNLMELLIFLDTLRHASAGRVTAVIPYMFYVRSDKKDRGRVSITARLVAELLETAGAQRVLTMDLHSPQVLGFFRIPVDHLTAAGILCRRLQELDLTHGVVVAADAGEAKGIGAFANRLMLPIAVIDKRRVDHSEKPKAVGIAGALGELAILVDDEIASGSTVQEATTFLRAQGAHRVIVAATHGVFTGDALRRLAGCGLERVMVTDTLPSRQGTRLVETVTVTELFADAVRNIHTGSSVSALFDGDGSLGANLASDEESSN